MKGWILLIVLTGAITAIVFGVLFAVRSIVLDAGHGELEAFLASGVAGSAAGCMAVWLVGLIEGRQR